MRTLALLALLMLPLSAVAEERIGLAYSADSGQFMRCLQPQFGEEWSLYLVIRDVDVAALSGWEAALIIGGDPYLGPITLYGDAVNHGEGLEFVVTYAAPRPTTPWMLLARIDFLTLQYEDPYCIELRGVDAPAIPGDLPVVHADDGVSRAVEVDGIGIGRLYQIGICPPVPETPYICSDPTPAESRTWGALKALY